MAVYRAMAYGPSQGEYSHATNYGHFGQLQQGDIAVSPNLLAQFPFGTRVDAIDPKTEQVLRSGLRVADTSWISANKPTTNSFELWNDQDLGHAILVPSGGSSASSSSTAALGSAPDTTSTVSAPTPSVAPSDTGIDPALVDAINRTQATQALGNTVRPGGAGVQGGGNQVVNALSNAIKTAQIIQKLRGGSGSSGGASLTGNLGDFLGSSGYRAGVSQGDPFGAGGAFDVAA